MEANPPQEVGKDVEAVLPRRGSIELRRLNAEANDPVRHSDPRDKVSPYQRPEVIYAPEKNGTWMGCLKYGLFAFNAVIWSIGIHVESTMCLPGPHCIFKCITNILFLLGIAILGVGIWLKVNPDFWTLQLNLDVTQFSSAAVVAIVVGVIILIIGFIGCCGAIRNNIYLLSTFFVILLILVILEAVAMGIVWSMVNDQEFSDKIAAKISKGINNHSSSSELDYFLAVLQSRLECCGVKGADEYSEFPRSCINHENGLPYDRGCMKLVTDYLKSKASMLGGVCIITLLLQIGAMIFSMCLICGIRQADKEIF